MGGTGWNYVTPYRGSVEASLAALHAEEFRELYGDGEEFGSIEELWADERFMGEEGTHSILDVTEIVHTTAPAVWSNPDDYGTLRPLHPDRIRYHFGTERPTPDQFHEALDRAEKDLIQVNPPTPDRSLLGENPMRWTAIHVLLYAHDAPEPTHVGILGSSGD